MEGVEESSCVQLDSGVRECGWRVRRRQACGRLKGVISGWNWCGDLGKGFANRFCEVEVCKENGM